MDLKDPEGFIPTNHKLLSETQIGNEASQVMFFPIFYRKLHALTHLWTSVTRLLEVWTFQSSSKTHSIDTRFIYKIEGNQPCYKQEARDQTNSYLDPKLAGNFSTTFPKMLEKAKQSFPFYKGKFFIEDEISVTVKQDNIFSK